MLQTVNGPGALSHLLAPARELHRFDEFSAPDRLLSATVRALTPKTLNLKITHSFNPSSAAALSSQSPNV